MALTDLDDVCHLVQAVSRSKLLPNPWHLIASTAEASDSAVHDSSRDRILTLLCGSFRVGSGLAHVVNCAIAILTADARLQAEEWEVVMSLLSKYDAEKRKHREFMVVHVPQRSVRRIIGEFGATIRNIEMESGAAIRLEEEPFVSNIIVIMIVTRV